MPLRGRTVWKCNHCNEVQFTTANSDNKLDHLRKAHGITKAGNKTPRQWNWRQTQQNTTPTEETRIRKSEAYIQLPIVVKSNPFQEAIVAFIVLCQMALSLVESKVFLEFLLILYPSIESLLPKKDLLRQWIISLYQSRQLKIKTMLSKSQSQIHFSFDLWTSPNHLALLGIMAHFIDEHAQNQTVSLCLSSS
jgi:hypothetical protein